MSHQFLTHCILRIVTVMTFAATLCFSADVKVIGTVKDIDGKPIVHAKVYLDKEKIVTTTNQKGEFDLGHPVGVKPPANVSQNKRLSAHLKDGVLLLNIFKSGPVEITSYDLNGKTIFSMQKVMDAGTHNVKLPLRGNGVYINRIKSGAGEMVLKNSPLGGVSIGSSIELAGIVTTTKEASVEFEALPAWKAWHKDIMIIKAPGFVDYDINVNNYDTNYKEIVMLPLADTVRDADGNLYQAVKIGDQIWATSSLRTTKFNDGTDIPNRQDGKKWVFTPFSTELHLKWTDKEMDDRAGYCDQETKQCGEISKTWGKLYNWYAARHPKIAPKGWHVPSRDELFQLRTYLVQNGYNWDETKYPEWNVKANDDGKVSKTSKEDMAKNKCAKAVASRTFQKEIPHVRGSKGNVGNDIRTNNRTGFNCKPLGSRWCCDGYHSIESSCYLWSTTFSDEELNVKPQGYHISFHGIEPFFGTNDHETRSGWQIRFLKDK